MNIFSLLQSHPSFVLPCVIGLGVLLLPILLFSSKKQSSLNFCLSVSSVCILASVGLFFAPRNFLNENSSPEKNQCVVAGEETENNTIENSVIKQVEGAFSQSPQFNFHNGILTIREEAITSKELKRHSIEAEDIDSNSITSRTIKDHTITGIDISKHADVTVEELTADDLTAQNLAIAETIDFETNTIADGIFSGNWNFGNGDITTTGVITGSFAGGFTPSGDLDMLNHILTNIGNSGTDFDTSGGLTLAGSLTLSGTSGILKSTGGVISGSSTTSDLPEGTNLYYTQARFDTAFSGKSTTNLSEGTNLYYLDSRTRAAISENITGIGYDNSTGIFSLTASYVIPTTTEESNWNTAYTNRVDTWNYPLSFSGNAANLNYNATNLKITFNALNTIQDIGTSSTPTFGGLTITGLSGVLKAATGIVSGSATTSDLSEGTNLYYTQARFDTAFSGKSTTNLTEGTNLYFTDERVDDRVAVLIQSGTGISWVYSDSGGTFTPTVSLSPFSTSNLAEGSNLYYLDSRARVAISETITGISYDNSTGTFSLTTNYVIPTTTEESNWNTAYGWGNHAVAGYFVKASDTLDNILAGSTNVHLTTTLKSNYDTAYSHSQATSNVHGLTFTAEGSGGGLDADLLDGHEATYFAVATGSGNYIQNQFASGQSGQFWISGQSRIDNELLINTADLGDYKLQLVGNMAITGNIIPTADNTYSLGSATNMWRDVYIGPGSLYVNGQKVIQEDLASDIVVTADSNQSLRIKTSGTGDIELNPSGSGQILLKSNLRLSGGKYIETSDGTAVLFDDGINPNINNAYGLGSASKRWADVYAVNANSSTLTVSGQSSFLGNVGVGTTNPGSKIDVNGLIRVAGSSIPSSGEGLEIAYGSNIAALTSFDRTNTLYKDIWMNALGYRFLSSGTASLVVDNSGNVGIGTTNPSAKLNVVGSYVAPSGNQIVLGVWGTSGLQLIGQSGDVAIVGTMGASESLTFRTASSEKMRILENGNVGIGTTNPGGKLVIYDSGAGSLRVGDTSDGLAFGKQAGVGLIQSYDTAGNSYNDLYLQTGIASGTGIYIQTNGNVGIGTTAPGDVLHVHAGINGNLWVRPAARTGGTSNGLGLQSVNDAADAPVDMNFRASQFAFIVGDAEKLRIDTSGNVGIGTTGPGSKLEINTSTASDGLWLRNGATNMARLYRGSSGTNPGVLDLFASDAVKVSINGEVGAASYFNSGNVGIGTTSPGAKLDIGGSGRFQAGSGATSDYMSISPGNSTTGTNLTSATLLGSYTPMVIDASTFQFRASASDTNTLFINSSGNVGMGTTEPKGMLHLSGSSKFVVQSTSGGYGQIQVVNTNNSETSILINNNVTGGIGGTVTVSDPKYGWGLGLGRWNTAADVFTITATSATTGIAIQSNGNVGIGTVGPNFRLQVRPSNTYGSLTGDEIAITSSASGGTVSNPTGVGSLVFGDPSVTNSYMGRIQVIQNNPSLSTRSDMAFSANNGGGNAAVVEIMRLIGTGNVGIGNAAPGSLLSVGDSTTTNSELYVNGASGYTSKISLGQNGVRAWHLHNLATSGDLLLTDGEVNNMYWQKATGNVGIGTTSPIGKLDVVSANGAGANNFYIRGGTSAGDYGILAVANGTTTRGRLVADASVDAFRIDTSGGASTPITFRTGASYAEQMRITSDGNVGIGTTNPTSYSNYTGLTVNGTSGSFIAIKYGSAAGGEIGSNASELYIQNKDALPIQFYNSTGAKTVVITDSGKVGIGTTAPIFPVQVSKSANDYNLQAQRVGGAGIGLWTSTAIGALYTTNAYQLELGTNGNTQMAITTGGNVGIGVTNPADKLDVSGAIRTSNGIVYSPGNGNTWYVAGLGNGPILALKYDAGAGGPANRLGYLGWQDNGGNKSVSLSWDDSDNVGVGTTSPSAKVDIMSSITNGFSPTVRINRTSAANNDQFLSFGNGTSYDAQIGRLKGSDDLIFGINSGISFAEKMRMTTGGNVGIGTTSPSSALDINGTATIQVPGTGGLRLITNIAGVGAGLTARNVASESIVQFGNNLYSGYTGPIDYTKAGAMIRLDTRNGTGSTTYGGQSYTLFQIQTREAGVADGTHTIPFQLTAAPTGSFIMGTTGLVTLNHGLNVMGTNVGIGTTDPSGLLDVRKWSSGTGEDVFVNFGYDTINPSRIKLYASSWEGVISLYDSGNREDVRISTITNGNSWFSNGGNVGIGTTAPGSPIHVKGIGDYYTLRVESSNTVGPGIRFQGSGTYDGNTWSLIATGSGNGGTGLGKFALWDETNNQARLVVDNGGNVGIGTTNPGALLHVYGSGSKYMQVETSGGNSYGAGIIFTKSGSQWNAGVGAAAGGNDFEFYHNTGSKMAMVLQATSGNVGIGTTSPGAKLNVNGDIQINSGASNDLHFTEESSYRSSMWYDQTNNALSFFTTNAEGTALEKIRMYGETDNGSIALMNGNVGIGTTAPGTKLQVTSTSDENVVTVSDSDGTCTLNPESGGSWSCTSDQRLKKDIANIDGSLEKVMNLRPVSFKMIKGGDTNFGFIAQEVQQVIPEAVSTLPNGYLGIAEGKFTPYIIGALQQQQSEISGLVSSTSMLTDNQNKIAQQISGQLADQTLSIDQKILLIANNLDSLANDEIGTIKDKISSANNNISDLSSKIAALEDQIAKIQVQSNEERLGLIESRLGNIEIALNVTGSNANIIGTLSVGGNIDLLAGKLTAHDVKVLGAMTAKNVEAEETVQGKTLTGENLELGKETRGKAQIKPGEKEVVIESSIVSKEDQIYVTPLGKLNGRSLYIDMKNVEDGKSFKVSLDGEALDEDIQFNWLIIK